MKRHEKELYEHTGHGGHCTDCAENRDGPNCERCRENYYQAPGQDICLPCNCDPTDVPRMMGPLLSALPPPCLSYCQHLPVPSPQSLHGLSEEARRRGEKRPIPAEMKDEKYFERRRRNNQAAKKSRDARRVREDQIAWRACLLEQENASLRAHVAALRQEALALRALLAADEPAVPTSTTAD